MKLRKLFIPALIVMVFAGCSKEDEGPNNLIVEAKDYGAFYLNWDGYGNNDMVYRSTGGAEPEFYADPDASAIYKDFDIENGTTYNYQIVSYTDSGEVTDMKSEIVTVTAEGFTTRINNLKISKDPSEPRNALIEWEVNFLDQLPEGATLKLSSKDDEYASYSQVEVFSDISAEGSHIDQYALNPGSLVYYQLELLDAEENELFSVDEYISVEHNYILTPTNVSASISNKASQEISISWDPAKDAEEYKIKYWVNNGTSEVLDADNNTEGTLTVGGTLESGDEITIQVGGQKENYREYSEKVVLEW